jgi:hypothetical protein
MGLTDALRAAYGLHVCLMRGATMAEHERQSSHAFPTNDADLDASLAGTVGDHRGEATLHEVDDVDAGIGSLQLRRDRQIDRSEVRLQQCHVRTGQAR